MSPPVDRRNVIVGSLGGVGLTATSSALKSSTVYTRREDGWHTVEDFGAVGDGRTDDTRAFEQALVQLPPGGILRLLADRKYRVVRSLVFQKPLRIEGGARGRTTIAFDNGAYAKLGGHKAAMIFPHNLTRPKIGDARHSSLSRISIEWLGHSDDPVSGVLVSTPVFFTEVGVVGFPNNGFHTEASSRAIQGNANGSSFINCVSRSNGNSGFHFAGNDANSCLIMASRAFDNGGSGFRDESLIGNVYVGAEVAGNRVAGYSSETHNPNSSIFVGCFSEIGQHYALNPRNVTIGCQGQVRTGVGSDIRSLATGDVALNGGIISFAPDTVNNSTKSRSPFARLSANGLELETADGQRFRLTKLLSSNYIDVLNGQVPIIRFPMRSVTQNISSERPWMPAGLTIGVGGKSSFVGAGATPPDKGTYSRGAIWLNEDPQIGAPVGWVCTAGGDPGQWHPFSILD